MSQLDTNTRAFVNPAPSAAFLARSLELGRDRALSQSVPDYRCRVVRLPHGHIEVAVTPSVARSVIAARMQIDPFAYPPRDFDDAARAERDLDNRARAAKRARQQVRYITKSLGADHLLTFTYRANVLDRQKVAADWKEFVRLYRVRYPSWSYCGVLEQQDRGAYHLHVAVKGRQPIKWLLRCWLIAIGQPAEDVSLWLSSGVKLGDKSMGAVNVEPPKKRWGSGSVWRASSLSSYLTKYISKEFLSAPKGAKKYWASKNTARAVIQKFWLQSTTFNDALHEAWDIVYYSGCDTARFFVDDPAGVIWIEGQAKKPVITLSYDASFFID